jgi:hypothetical protein
MVFVMMRSDGRRISHRCWVLVVLVVLGVSMLGACSCDKPPDDTTDKSKPSAMLPSTLSKKRVPGTSLALALPKSWEVKMEDPGPLPPKPTGPVDITSLKLNTRTLLQARPGQPGPGHLVAPMILVLEDPWLPLGAGAVDYLVAQRAANAAVIGSAVRHVDAEPSRREGRPAYIIRDEWTVPGKTPEDARDLTQDALLILEAVAPANDSEQPGLHGYTVVVTMEKSEREGLDKLVRAVLDSVEFLPSSPRPTTPSAR